MPYIDTDYYANTYKGKEWGSSSLLNLIEKANDDIDRLTGYRITDFESLHISIQERVKKAVCAQVEHLITTGDEVRVKQNFAIGKFRYSTEEAKNQTEFSRRAISYLIPTGLFYSGVGVL